MGLKDRKIITMLNAHAVTCWEQINKKLNTQFKMEFDGSTIPEAIGGWNWDDEDLKKCLYHNTFEPIEQAMPELFADKMYEEAIREQVKGFTFLKGRSGATDFEFKDGMVQVLHELSVNYGRGDAGYVKSTANGLKEIIEKKLS